MCFKRFTCCTGILIESDTRLASRRSFVSFQRVMRIACRVALEWHNTPLLARFGRKPGLAPLIGMFRVERGAA
jgi:hypothetical protein